MPVVLVLGDIRVASVTAGVLVLGCSSDASGVPGGGGLKLGEASGRRGSGGAVEGEERKDARAVI
jgi:hypothetical protein